MKKRLQLYKAVILASTVKIWSQKILMCENYSNWGSLNIFFISDDPHDLLSMDAPGYLGAVECLHLSKISILDLNIKKNAVWY